MGREPQLAVGRHHGGRSGLEEGVRYLLFWQADRPPNLVDGILHRFGRMGHQFGVSMPVARVIPGLVHLGNVDLTAGLKGVQGGLKIHGKK